MTSPSEKNLDPFEGLSYKECVRKAQEMGMRFPVVPEDEITEQALLNALERLPPYQQK